MNHQSEFKFARNITANTTYTVHLTAEDAFGNCQFSTTVLTVRTEDNIAPVFLSAAMSHINGHNATASFQLDQPAMLSYVLFNEAHATSNQSSDATAGSASLVDHASHTHAMACPPGPTIVQYGASLAPPASINSSNYSGAGQLDARLTSLHFLNLTGLEDDTPYLLCLAARDVSAYQNMQQNTTPLPFTTPDVTPPIINFLSVLITPPTLFTINVTVDKPGVVKFLARKAAEPAATASEVLQSGSGNFSGSVSIPVAGLPTVRQLCVADGLGMILYGVAQDINAIPNNSTVSR